ncbi:MAG: hypothetical protein NTW85_14545 [Methylococcales bacterium]|nr:hypothetical protein [Methylococcales bacterium]
MKLNALRLLSIACLLLITSISYAAEATLGHQSKNNAKVNMEETDYEGDTPQGASSRSIGNALAHKSKISPVNPDKQRIEELEDLVSQQQKLIEMYKNRLPPE